MIELSTVVSSQGCQRLAEGATPERCRVVYARFWQSFGVEGCAPYVLLTNYHDRPIVGPAADRILADERLLAWFGVNAVTPHPKLRPLPLGVDEAHRKAMQAAVGLPKEHLLYLNCRAYNEERAGLYRQLGGKAFCRTAPHDKHCLAEYYAALAQSWFVLSPAGHGLDCFRTWEAMALGAVPVLRRGPLAPLFEGLPALVVEDWEEVTEQFLLEQHPRFYLAPALAVKLLQRYWSKQVRTAAKGEAWRV